MRDARTWAALAMGASVAAVGQPAAAQTPVTSRPSQAPVAGTYELVEAGGSPLPTTVEETTQCVERVTAGTLVLEWDGDWQLELTESETCGTDVSDDTETEEGDYVVSGDEIDFRPDEDDPEDEGDEPDELDIDDLSTGTIAGDTIRVRIHGTETEAVFRRVQG